MITNHDEASLGLLRYSLGGYRPSKTARLTMSVPQFHGVTLDSQLTKTGISRMTPAALADSFQRLPVILHIASREPISKYSKGSRGLSV